MLEVLVAVPALVLLCRQGAVAMGAARTAATYQEPISRAQLRLDALTGTGLTAGEKKGGGLRWRVRIAPVASSAIVRIDPSSHGRGWRKRRAPDH